MTKPLHLVLEFARAASAGQPHGFRFAPQPYLLRTPGGGFESAEFPWSPELLDDLNALRAVAPTPEVAHRIGAVLRDFLGRAGWMAHEQAIVDALQAGAPIHVTIRSAAAELYALPWELLALKSTGQLLGGIPGLVVRYEWPETASFPDQIAPDARRGRVLFAWSAAGGRVPAPDHLAALQAALGAHGFDPARDVVADASFAAIAEALERARRDGPPIDALHVLCHGAPAGTTFGLAFDDESDPGERVVVDAGRLQQLVAPHTGMLRLVVLAACDSGNVGELGNHLGSVAQMIHRAGLRGVVASRFPLSAAGSSRLTAALYAALARPGTTLERAFLAAREALVRDAAQLDWASVQLYARAADGDESYPLAIVGAPQPPAVRPHAPPTTATTVPTPQLPAPPTPAPRPTLAFALAAILAAAAVALAIWRPWSTPETPTAPPVAAIADPAPPRATTPIDAEPIDAEPTDARSIDPPPTDPPPTDPNPTAAKPTDPPPTDPKIRPTPRPTRVKPTPDRPAKTCPRLLQPIFKTNLPAPASGVVPPDFRVSVTATGAITYASDDADYAAKLRAKRPAQLTPAQLAAHAADLPCNYKVVSR